jgi:broad specificity phosphatase PhoE
MKIYIARHGQTDLNKQKKTMGRIDQSLNQDGISQAQALIPELEKINFDVIFSSTLLRAKETAEIIANHFKIVINFDERIIERDFGSLGGKTWDEIKEYSGKENLKEDDSQQIYDYRPYGGESVEDVKERYLSFIEEIKDKYSDKTVLVVAHGGILRLSHFLYKNQELREIKNASIHEFDL